MKQSTKLKASLAMAHINLKDKVRLKMDTFRFRHRVSIQPFLISLFLNDSP